MSRTSRIANTLMLATFFLTLNALAQQKSDSAASTQAPLTLTLQDALTRARANSIPFQSAITDQRVAHEDKVQARAALLPSVNFNNQFIYTEPNGTASGVFVANNSVHEYLSQGNVHQVVGYTPYADFRRSQALEAVARSKAEIARRGLVVTVVQGYYGLIASQRKYANAQQAATEAQNFLALSQKLENGGEVAHSDVIKAQLQFNDRQRDLREAQLAMDKSRLDLAVLLFPDFNLNFTVVDNAQLAPPLMSFDDFMKTAQNKNPDLRASAASFQASKFELTSAQSGYFPTLTIDYFYGIDAPHFAKREPDGTNNLGYAVAATLNIPVWNWGATHSKVVQADLKRKQAQRELTLAQRKLQADMRELYAEAEAAQAELETLKSSADLAAESLRLTNLRYQGGEATVLEVVDAQNTLTQARNAFNDGEVRARTALANLQTLTGTM
ncbi:MAG TPA: TolC family protein [Candidatus Angelobacter sp.]|nr:TolC family protein [Candidatus Angelobacter sp.]